MNEERKFRIGEPVILSKSYVRFKLSQQGEKVPNFLLNDSPAEVTMFVKSWRLNNDLGHILCKFLYNVEFNNPLYQIKIRDAPEGRLQSIPEYCNKKVGFVDERMRGIDFGNIVTSATNQFSSDFKLISEVIKKAVNNMKMTTPPPFLPDYDTIMNMHLHKTDIKKNECEGKEMIKPDESNIRIESFAPLFGEREALRRLNNAFTPVQIIFNPPATIVFWKDGTKTVVKCEPNEKFNKYHGFCAAVCKKMYNSNSAMNKMITSVDISKEGQMRLNAQKVTIPSYEQKPAAKPQKGIRLKEEPKKKGSRK